MKKILIPIFAIILLVSPVFADEELWIGNIAGDPQLWTCIAGDPELCIGNMIVTRPGEDYDVPGASRAGGGGGFSRGYNEIGDCLKDENCEWIGDETSGYCECKEEKKEISLLSLFDRLVNVDISQILESGTAIPYGYLIIFLTMLFLFKTIPHTIKEGFKQKTLSTFIKAITLFVLFSATIILIWTRNNINFSDWRTIGAQISPSQHIVGWALFLLGMYYIFYVFVFLLPKIFIRIQDIFTKKPAAVSEPAFGFGSGPFVGGKKKQKKKARKRHAPVRTPAPQSNIFKELGIKIPTKRGELK